MLTFKRGICVFASIPVFVAVTASAAPAVRNGAQNPEQFDQTARPNDQLTPLTYEYKPMPPQETVTLGDIFKNIHASYSVSLMGPRVNGSSDETYNVYNQDISPIQLYHTVTIGYQVSPDLQIGVNRSAPQNLTDNVVGNNGYVYNHSWELYDPNVYFNLPNLVHVQGWFVFTQFQFSLPMTAYSEEIGRMTSLQFFQNWNINNFPSDWTFGISWYANPTFYSDPKPPGFAYRQTFTGNISPHVSYRISPNFSMEAAAKFDIEHRAPLDEGTLNFGSGLPDTFRVRASITPNIFPMWMSIGGYYQILIFKPTVDTSIVGADFAIGF